MYFILGGCCKITKEITFWLIKLYSWQMYIENFLSWDQHYNFWNWKIYQNGSIPRNALVLLTAKQHVTTKKSVNTKKCDYQTDRQTDAGQSDPSVNLPVFQKLYINFVHIKF